MNSPDAFAFGTRNTPDDAYRFCKGEPIKLITSGETHQKKTPYDWCALTDHAEYMGIMPLLLEKNNPLADTEIGKLIASGDPKQGAAAFQQIITSVATNKPIPYMVDPKVMSSIWEEQKKVTNKHNDPGKFTTLIAFEWTSIPQYQNMHHNVFFRDDKGPYTQFSSFDSVKREDLWTYQEVQRAMGHENFSIPHNGNVSNGLMFAPTTSYGTPITKEWAERSTANTVATEIAQVKGASETLPSLSPTDEFAGYENYFLHLLGSGGVDGKISGSYVRQGLITGIDFQEKLGANPTSSASSAARIPTTRCRPMTSSIFSAPTATPTRHWRSGSRPADPSPVNPRASFRPPPPRRSGRRRTPAKPSSTRSRARRPSAPPGR